jgi:hypothetical protein
MHEAILRNLSSLATLVRVDESTAILAEHSNILHFAVIALILVFVTAGRAKRKDGGFFQSLLARCRFSKDGAADRMFERHHIQPLKKCPNCTEQWPLSVLICEACDYNFLSGMVGHGHRMLPSPEPQVHEMPARILAYRA